MIYHSLALLHWAGPVCRVSKVEKRERSYRSDRGFDEEPIRLEAHIVKLHIYLYNNNNNNIGRLLNDDNDHTPCRPVEDSIFLGFFLDFFGLLERLLVLHSGQIGAFLCIA